MESGARQPKGVVGATHLSHGTLMCRNLVDSRRFYEEFLGLEVVRHARPAIHRPINWLRRRAGRSPLIIRPAAEPST